LDLLVAFVAGLAAGALVTGLTMRRTPEGRLALRPSRRQQRILAALPPNPDIPTIADLVREEAEALGVEEVAGGDGIALHVRLKVWKRDHDPDRCHGGRWVFRLRSGVAAADAGPDDVSLECEETVR
jgi:hypothetical protein